MSPDLQIAKLPPIPKPLPRINVRQLRQMQTIAKKCCNYDDGNCLLLDHGEEHICPQSITKTVVCRWFYHAVMPPAVQQKMKTSYSPKEKRKCQVCGKPYIAKSNNTKYCKACAAEIHRKQIRDSVRKHRHVNKLNPQMA